MDDFNEVSKGHCRTLQVDILGRQRAFPIRPERNELAYKKVSPHGYSSTGHQGSCLRNRDWPVVNCISSLPCAT